MKTLTPPKGVRLKSSEVEGGELFDHDDEGSEIDITELAKEFEELDEEDELILRGVSLLD